MRLTRILLVETSEICWYLATFCKWHCRKPKASSVLTNLQDCFSGADTVWKARKDKGGWDIRVSNPKL